MEDLVKKSKNNVGLHLIFITLLVTFAALASKEYRIWIILASPAIFTIWLLWLWSKRLSEIDERINNLEKEKNSGEKLLKTIKDITEVVNNVKKR